MNIFPSFSAAGTATAAPAGPSNFPPKRALHGSQPGVLDPTQPARLLRYPTSRLSFASFDPRTAVVDGAHTTHSHHSHIPDIRKLNIKDELNTARRVVIESTAEGISFWRFVPSAKRERGVENEGAWPRIVDYCGEFVECSQDQWDIHKLDPAYECVVQVFPMFSTIKSVSLPTPKSTTTPTPAPPSPTKKPTVSTSQPPMTQPIFSRQGVPPPHTRVPPSSRSTRQHTSSKSYRPPPPTTLSVSDTSSEEEEVEYMTVESTPGHARPQGPQSRARQMRQTLESKRRARREKISKAMHTKYSSVEPEESGVDFTSNGHANPNDYAEYTAKRKTSQEPGSGWEPEEDEDKEGDDRSRTKRLRTVSPDSIRREWEEKKAERRKAKQARDDERFHGRKQAKNSVFMQNVFSDLPEELLNSFSTQASSQETPVQDPTEDLDAIPEEPEPPERRSAPPSPLPEAMDEEAARQAAIEESKRKLAELEADRPLWEAAAHARMERERQEEEVRQRKAAERHRSQTHEAEASTAQRAHEERLAAEREAQKRREQEHAARLERERRARQQRERWAFGPWTTGRALERYKTLCETFDSTKFTPVENPLTFEAVPWPVLASPVTFRVEDVDWSAVERFFEAVRGLMRPQDYKVFMEKSHRRFHPDRWRSRGLLMSVIDEEERACLEVASNTVAQALTPLWREIKG